jgi:hypothetical protein
MGQGTLEMMMAGRHLSSKLYGVTSQETAAPFPSRFKCDISYTVLYGGTMLQARRSRVRVPMRSLDFFNLPNASSRTMALESTQPLIEMSTRNLPGGVKSGRHVMLTILPPSVSRLSTKMWEPRRLTTLWAFTAYYRNSFTLPFYTPSSNNKCRTGTESPSKPEATYLILLFIK